MKKVTFLIDDESYKLLKSVVWAEDKTVSRLLRVIVTKRIREMAYQKGILNTRQIKEFRKEV